MNGICLMWVALSTWASDDVALLRDEVDAAATAVSEARIEGARRSQVAALMATYRRAAEALALREGPPAGLDAEALRGALAGLTEAVATGKRGATERAAVVAAVGTPADRLPILEGALEATLAVADPALRTPLLFDLGDQAQALAVVCAWDMAEADETRRRLEVHLAAATASVPGQTPGVGHTLLIDRLRVQALEAVEATRAHRARRDRFVALTSVVHAALERE